MQLPTIEKLPKSWGVSSNNSAHLNAEGLLTIRFRIAYFSTAPGTVSLADLIVRYEHGLIPILNAVLSLTTPQKEILSRVPRANQSEHKPYSEYYNEKTAALVRDLDSFIFKYCGYPLELPNVEQ
jgi:hypothetical protein